MEAEDLGINPMDESPNAHERAVLQRITAGRTYVIEQDNTIVFQINIGSQTDWGCQVGGTYVPRKFRGRGIAQAAMKMLCQRLLRDHPRVTLHVNEANRPAVRAYERSGFEANAPYRLVVINQERRF